MRAKDCPKWHSCSAGFCPLDRAGVHIKDDPVCLYLREFYKENAKTNFINAGVGHIYAELETIAPQVITGSKLIRKEIQKSSKTNSRLARSGQKKTEANEKDSQIGEGYRTVTVQEVGKGITKAQYTPIPPLADSQNSMYESRLTGDRNQCGACRQYFNSTTAFDKHRTGEFNGHRTCLSTDEMLARGFGKTSDGFWLAPIVPEDRERLTRVRASQGIRGNDVRVSYDKKITEAAT
ncbi:MAG: hypothetical protein K0S36_411 [Nitrosospira multiformis]|jgi:hypothetical protein|nr:hypothetical protein [Nitrosospira multiformis]